MENKNNSLKMKKTVAKYAKRGYNQLKSGEKWAYIQ